MYYILYRTTCVDILDKSAVRRSREIHYYESQGEVYVVRARVGKLAGAIERLNKRP